jgi:hypothetical protein
VIANNKKLFRLTYYSLQSKSLPKDLNTFPILLFWQSFFQLWRLFSLLLLGFIFPLCKLRALTVTFTVTVTFLVRVANYNVYQAMSGVTEGNFTFYR